MAGMNVGLISGMDTASLIDSLMQVEANPQKLLQNKLLGTQADAKAYREINTRFDALRSAADALTKSASWGAATASSSSPGVAATATSGATAGSVIFTVQSLAARHTMVTETEWAAPTANTILVISNSSDPQSSSSVPLAAGATVTDAVAAINAANSGVTATAINTGSGYRLQLASTTVGADGAFTLTSDIAFQTMAQGKDAVLQVGSGAEGAFAYEVTSKTNTFSDLMPGVTLTASQQGGPVTVSVASDPEAVAAAVGALIKAANDVLSGIKNATSTTAGSAGVLKGDSTLRALSSKVLEAVSSAVGGDGSAAQAGIQLDRYGAITFDSKAFVSALAASPELAQRLVNGTGTGDAAVPGVGQRLLAVAKNATDSTTGTLTLKAKSQDTLATDLQKRIENWDLRLLTRRGTLERQFTAMESALSSLQNQSSWLSSQISSLPSWSSSSKS